MHYTTLGQEPVVNHLFLWSDFFFKEIYRYEKLISFCIVCYIRIEILVDLTISMHFCIICAPLVELSKKLQIENCFFENFLFKISFRVPNNQNINPIFLPLPCRNYHRKKT